MILAKLELGRILDGDDAFVLGDEAAQDVERGRLSRAGAAADHDVHLPAHTCAKKANHVLRDRSVFDQVIDGQRLFGELSDGHRRSTQRERRNDHVDAGPILEARVDHRRRLIDAAADAADDPVDDLHQLLVALERHRAQRQLAVLLDVDLLVAVDHDFGDVLAREQLLERSETEHVIDEDLDEAETIGPAHRDVLLGDHVVEQLGDTLADDLGWYGVGALGELLDEALVHLATQRHVSVDVATHLAQSGAHTAGAVQQGRGALRFRGGRRSLDLERPRRGRGSCRHRRRRDATGAILPAGRRERFSSVVRGAIRRPGGSRRRRRAGCGRRGSSLCFPLHSVEQRHESSNHLV